MPLIWLNVPYAGPQGELLTKGLVRKLRRYLKKNTRIVVRHKSKYLSFLCSNKDKIPIEQRANVIYEVQCPGCGEKYTVPGSINRCSGTWLHVQLSSIIPRCLPSTSLNGNSPLTATNWMRYYKTIPFWIITPIIWNGTNFLSSRYITSENVIRNWTMA